MDSCPFCTFETARIWIANDHAVAVAAVNPVADGHTLVVSDKHVASVYELSMEEQKALWDLVGEVRHRLLTGLRPDGFSIGFSDVLEEENPWHHAHVHIVPRRRGEDPDLPMNAQWVTDDHVLAWKK